MPESSFMIFLKDYGFVEIILPFILVFAIVYGILSKTHILGKNNKRIEIIVSLVLGLVAIGSLQFSGVLQELIAKLGFGIVILLGLALILGFFGVPFDNKITLWISSIIFLIIVIVQFTSESINDFFINLIKNPITIGLAIIIFIFWLLIRTKEEKQPEEGIEETERARKIADIRKGTEEMEKFRKGELPIGKQKNQEENQAARAGEI